LDKALIPWPTKTSTDYASEGDFLIYGANTAVKLPAMRMIGHLEGEARARAFSDYLYAQGIENQVEPDKDGTWALWIHSEEELEKAKSLLAAYRQNAADPEYQSAGTAAQKLREAKKKEQSDYEKRLKKRRHLFRPVTGYGFGPVTFLLIGVSVVVFVLSKYGYDLKAIHSLFISEPELPNAYELGGWDEFVRRISAVRAMLPEVRQGELWRVFTPMFIHMTILHILFNMLWLRDLGSMVEARQSSWLLAVLVLVFAAGSNLAQYFVSGPIFGGMSGVVYALVGYIWIRGKLDPGSGLYLHPTTVTMMIIWFFACLFHLVGNVANTAHGAGLVMGMAWGWLSSIRHR
jgi:GlpG protein